MTRDEAVAMMKQVLGFKQNLDESCVLNLKMQQLELELSPTKPWFLLTERATFTTVAGERRVPLPPDFLEEYEEGCLCYVPADAVDEDDEIELKKTQLDILKAVQWDDCSTGTAYPQAYALVGNYFILGPIPDDAYNIKMRYYAKDTVLDSNIENQWLKHAPSVLIGQAGAVLAASLRDWEAKKQFDSMQQKAVLLLENQNEARKHANLDLQIGGPH